MKILVSWLILLTLAVIAGGTYALIESVGANADPVALTVPDRNGIAWGDGKDKIVGRNADRVIIFVANSDGPFSGAEAYLGDPRLRFQENMVFYISSSGRTPFGAGAGAFIWSTDYSQAVFGPAIWNGTEVLANSSSVALVASGLTAPGAVQLYCDDGLRAPTAGADGILDRYPYVPTECARVDKTQSFVKKLQVGGQIGVPDPGRQLSATSQGTDSKPLYIGTGIVQVSPSDARMKDNIRPFATDSDAWLKKLWPYLREYDYNELYAQKQGQHAAGFISQEMLGVTPELVTGGQNGSMYGYDYQMIVPYLIDAYVKLTQRIAQLEGKSEKPIAQKPYTLKVEKPKAATPVPAPALPMGRGDGNGKKR